MIVNRIRIAILFLFAALIADAQSKGWNDRFNEAKAKFESRQQSECIPLLESLTQSLEKESKERTLTKEEQSIIEKSYDLLGQAEFNQNEQAKARSAFHKLLEWNPEYKMNEDLVSQKIIKLFNTEKRTSLATLTARTAKKEEVKSEPVNTDRVIKTPRNSGALLREAYAHMEAENYGEAEKKYTEALSAARETGDKANQANALLNLGFLFSSSGREPQAIPYWEESLSLSREVGDRSREALALYNLAIAAYNRGDLKKADELYEQSVQVSKILGEEPRKKIW
jgi:tetratricopeptide (TPR) repeat protein